MNMNSWVTIKARVDLTGLHDVLVDLFGDDFHADTPETLLPYFNMLQVSTQCIAILHGGNDTVFRDEAYAFFEQMKEKK
jgi:hypothetical protein